MNRTEYFQQITDSINLKNEHVALDKLLELRNERPLTLSKIEIGSKNFNDWRAKGLMDFLPLGDDRNWIRLNLQEYIWVRLVDLLRRYGVTYEVLSEIKKYLLEPIDLERYVYELGFEEYVDEKYKRARKEGQSVTKKWLHNLLLTERKSRMAEITKRFGVLTTMDNVFLLSFMHKFLLDFIYLDGELFPYSENINPSSAIENALKTQSHIRIPLFGFITDLIENKNLSRSDLKGLFSDKDLRILEFINGRLKKGEKVTGYDPDGFVWIEKEEPKDSNLSALCKIEQNQNVKITVRNGVRIKITRELRQRIKE